MHLSSTRHLGGTITAGSAAAGTRYASHTVRADHTYCWMELAVFDKFPNVPSLAGTQVQGRNDLLASTAGAGTPQEQHLMLQLELFDDECPQLCANFRRLCKGESATRNGQVYCHQGLTPSYRGTYFHKIIPSYCAQGGDITMRVVPGGSNSYSSAGRGWLPDESKKRRHNEVGLVSMANNGPNSNGSQFFITTSAANERSFNGRHCCVGRVVDGLEDFLRLVAPFGDKDGRPSRYAVVVDCGDGAAPSRTFDATSTDAVPSSDTFAETASDVVPAESTETAAEVGGMDTVTDDDLRTVATGEGAAVPEKDIVVQVVEASGEQAANAVPPSAAAAAELPPAPASAQPLKSSMKKRDAPSDKHVTYQE